MTRTTARTVATILLWHSSPPSSADAAVRTSRRIRTRRPSAAMRRSTYRCCRRRTSPGCGSTSVTIPRPGTQPCGSRVRRRWLDAVRRVVDLADPEGLRAVDGGRLPVRSQHLARQRGVDRRPLEPPPRLRGDFSHQICPVAVTWRASRRRGTEPPLVKMICGVELGRDQAATKRPYFISGVSRRSRAVPPDA
jgi:hypothetical protein